MPDFVGEAQIAGEDAKQLQEAIKGIQDRQSAFVRASEGKHKKKGVVKDWTSKKRCRKAAWALLAALDHQAIHQSVCV